MIQDLIKPSLLRSVRSEIQDHLSFTPKETDIYRIHQSGDLANLDGLDISSLKLLPSLLNLRDALYSSRFREYLTTVTGSGPLSGRKTDMAINVYTPGCHLLCHDDVIGSRRVSYILYLTDPDRPWKKEWGGALRLYPTREHVEQDGQVTKVPSPDFSASIPPAFNQLSFFGVQPGESFHDVEEVYAREEIEPTDDGGRVRMAISGWYHIPQEGEEGFEEGLEEKLAEKSSLMQLQGKGDKYDLPQPQAEFYDTFAEPSASVNGSARHSAESPRKGDSDTEEFSAEELDFLLQYLDPNYLIPPTLAELNSLFSSSCSLRLSSFLSKKFASTLRTHITALESDNLPNTTPTIESTTPWTVAQPPHKHRFLFQQPKSSSSLLSKGIPRQIGSTHDTSQDPLRALLDVFLPSRPFRKWLHIATGLTLTSYDLLARRFRRGKDYTLATAYEEEDARLEITLGISPTGGWGDEDDEEVNEKDIVAAKEVETQDGSVGGYEIYMASGDTAEDQALLDTPSSPTGAALKSKPKPDPAVYQSAAATDADDEDGGVLFSMGAGWNRLSIVLRDKDTLRFTKFVSRKAKGDRWDLVGAFGVEENDEEEEEDGDDGNEAGKGVEEEETELEFVEESESTESDY